MNTTQTVNELKEPADRRRKFNEADRRKRRDIFRDIGAAYRAVATAAGFLPAEIRTAEAITLCHYEVAGQDYDKPRAIKLLLIGAKLSSYGESDKGKINTASNRTSHFFTDAQPRAGYQLITRYKAVEDNKAHEYVDHITPVAEIVAEYHAERRRAILSDNQDRKQARISEALDQLAVEALDLLPKCDAELTDDNGEVYAYLSDAEAKTYTAKNPNFKAQTKTTRPKRPLCSQDFDRIEDKLRRWIEDELEDAKARNSFDEARLWAARLKTKAPNWIDSWVRTEGRPDGREEEREKELIHVPEVGGQGVDEPADSDPETGADVEQGAPQQLGGKQGLSGNVCNTENFDSALDAAIWYARDGWPVLPVCNAREEGCSWPKHGPECQGRMPLVKGDGSGGYQAATTDLEKLQHFYKKYPDQGVALRLDGKVAVDADVKDGGPQSYREMADTFNLDATLEQATHSGGEHHIFYLPEGMPEGHLKSWTRVGDKVGLPGIDLKVGRNGLLFVEPTQGPKGFYRWVNVDAPLATLPRECADFLHDAQKAKAKAKAKARPASSASSMPQSFDSDQAKFFVDVSNGARHDRLLTVGNAMWHAGASESQVIDGMRYHAHRFSDPLNDDAWIVRTAASIAREVLR